MVKDWRHLKAMTLAHALNDDCHSLSPIDRLGLGIQALWLVLDHPDELLLPTLPINFWCPSSIHYRQLKPWINVQSTAKCTPSSPSIHHHLSTSIFTIAKAQRLTLPPLLHKDLLNRVCSASQPKARWWDDHISWSGFTLSHWGILRCRWRCLILAQSWLAEEKTKDFNCHSLCNVQFRSTFSLIELIEWIILQNYYAVCCKIVMILWEREIQFLHEMRSWPTLRQEEKILELKSEVSVCVCLHLRMPSSEQRSWQKK